MSSPRHCLALARRRPIEHGHALVSPLDGLAVAQEGALCLGVVWQSVAELSQWP
jgi:hypothetical protein